MTVGIVASGLRDAIAFFREYPVIAEKAATLAINEAASRTGMVAIRRQMRDEINFPSGYLENKGRLRVARKATRTSLEAIIRGRDRVTSLARFASGQTPENTRGRPIQVQVESKGKGKFIRRGFLIRLKNGNIGLAYRVRPGEQLKGSSAAIELQENVYLLYGPSVEQVFSGVAGDQAPDIANMVERHFLRQFARLARG